MKKLIYLIVIVLISSLVLTGCSLLSNISQVPATEQKYNENNPNPNVFEPGDLVAGQNINVGIVSVWNDDTDLCVEYQLSADAINDGWFLTETHWAWAIESADIPQKNGNPIPGQFLYGGDSLSGEISSYQECISPSELPLGTPIFIAAHAVVQRQIGIDEEGQPIFQTESAWAAGYVFWGKNWATYFDYCYGAGVLDPEASGATATDNADGTVTLEITVLDFCANGIEGLNPLVDFYVKDSVMTGTFYFGTSSIPGSGSTAWTESNGVYTVILNRNLFSARPAVYEDGWYRIWSIYVQGELVQEDLVLKTTYYMVGDWKMDLNTSIPRFIIIDYHVAGVINGFFGVGYDPQGNPTGTITGTINGRNVYMFYERTDIVTNYTAEFWGTIATNGNSMSGTWTSGTWTMVRQ